MDRFFKILDKAALVVGIVVCVAAVFGATIHLDQLGTFFLGVLLILVSQED